MSASATQGGHKNFSNVAQVVSCGWVYERGRNDNKLAYLVHRSIIFDSCIILGMLIKDVMSSIIFDSCITLGMLIKGVTWDVIYRLRRPLRQK